MPSLLVSATQGEGHQSLGGAQNVQRMQLHLVSDVSAQTRYVGNMYPRGVWHAGSAGVGSFPGDGSSVSVAFVSFDHFLHAESEEWWVPWKTVTGWAATSVWWRWIPGISVDVTVFW